MIGLLTLIWFDMGKYYISYDQTCLKEKAKEICEDNGYIFEGIRIRFGVTIYGIKTMRDANLIHLRFLPEELEECRR